MAKILIIMAAGLGSRYGGDKQIAGVGPSNEILLEYSVYDAVKSGFSKIIIIIKAGMESVLNPIVDKMKRAFPSVDFIFAHQDTTQAFCGITVSPLRTKPLGTVHAVLSAMDMIDSDFGVINADDFYGRQAFETLYDAMDQFNSKSNAALITYSLNKTLSKYGAVTRGVCCVQDGHLCKIHESYKVMAAEDGNIYESTADGKVALMPNAPVSMNMWGFSKDTLPYMIEYLKQFLLNMDRDDNSSECLLPVMAGDLLSAGVLNIKAYPTNENWFGITYRNDLYDSAKELSRRHKEGQYPNKLF